MYVPWLLNFIQKINFFPNVEGHFYLLYFVLITKFSDSGAYAVGSLIGKHKMIPRISPGKTWEGFGGPLWYRPARACSSRTWPEQNAGDELGACGHPGRGVEHLGGDRRFD